MPSSLRRRDLGRLFVGSLAALALAACGPARAAPTAEQLEMAERLADAMRAIPQLTDVEADVTTNVYTKPEITARCATLHDPNRDALVAIGTKAQRAVEAHQSPGHRVRAWVITTVAKANVKWTWAPAAPTTPTTDQQVDAIINEAELGATSVSLSDRVSSRWDRIRDDVALRAAPAGMRLVSRWLEDGSPAHSLTTTVHAGEPGHRFPLEQAIVPLLPLTNSVNVVVMDGAVKWQVSPAVDEATTAPFIDATITMLKLLRASSFTGDHLVEYSGPWWVTLLITDPVAVLTWRSDDDRATSEAVVTDLLGRVNA